MNQIDIYKLKLHDQSRLFDLLVTRVPGGWIYRFTDLQESGNSVAVSCSQVFVPFSNEFQPKQKFENTLDE